MTDGLYVFRKDRDVGSFDIMIDISMLSSDAMTCIRVHFTFVGESVRRRLKRTRTVFREMMRSAPFPVGSAYEALINAIGTISLGEVILQFARSSAGVSEVFSYWLEDGAPPVQLASSGESGSSKIRASLYSQHFHVLDPLFPMIQRGNDQDLITASVNASDIVDTQYRRECFDRPGLSEKVSFVRSYGARRYVLSFYRPKGSQSCRPDKLLQLAELSLPILRRHGELLGEEEGLTLLERLERRLRRAYPLLTPRENQVCARTLIGMTAEASAISLGISETSILTYRRRAYERYRISSAGQFIEHLLD